MNEGGPKCTCEQILGENYKFDPEKLNHAHASAMHAQGSHRARLNLNCLAYA